MARWGKPHHEPFLNCLFSLFFLEAVQTTKSDPKGASLHEMNKRYPSASRVHAISNVRKNMESKHAGTEKLSEVDTFLKNLPYGDTTVFGYTTLIDTEKKLKDVIFNREVPDAGLDKAECVALDYLRDGSFYSSTG